MASFDFRAVINQRGTQTYTHTDTQDEEEAKLEVAVHGALKTLVTDVFFNIKLNLFFNGIRVVSKSTVRTTSFALIQFVEAVILGKAFWHFVPTDSSNPCVSCDLGLGGEVMLMGCALQPPFVSLPASRFLLRLVF